MRKNLVSIYHQSGKPWETLGNPAEINWTKVDIYSLGVLFSDILMGEIRETPVHIDDLEDMGLSDELLDLLDLMRADDPESRFGIQDSDQSQDISWGFCF